MILTKYHLIANYEKSCLLSFKSYFIKSEYYLDYFVKIKH